MRFVPSADTSPRENRLTEAFAAVVERVPGLGRALANAWLAPDRPRHPCERPGEGALTRRLLEAMDSQAVIVETQVATGSRFVDLELRFLARETPSNMDVRLWVEIKHGTDPHSEQLVAYEAGVHDASVAAGQVVLLAPAASLPHTIGAEVPASVPQRCWERVAEICAQYATDNPVEQWLLDEFLAYLREGNLMTPESLGPEHLTALAFYEQASRALRSVCEVGKQYVTEHWDGEFSDEKEERGRPGYSASYLWPRNEEAGPPGSWLSWHVTTATGVHPLNPDGRVFFNAGLSVEKRRPLGTSEQTQLWQRDLTTGVDVDGTHVVFHQWSGNAERLHRVAYPHEVLSGRTIPDQGAALGRWIVQTFQTLRQPPTAYAG